MAEHKSPIGRPAKKLGNPGRPKKLKRPRKGETREDDLKARTVRR